MARKPREDFEGAWHHVMHRGARRSPIFLEDEHCLLFWSLLDATIDQFEIEVHGFSLMPNHTLCAAAHKVCYPLRSVMWSKPFLCPPFGELMTAAMTLG